uniref:Uncharacterized protein n=1 Tax=Anopheles culicifacies TaxID=139723 RepID=A0A182MPF5_9DIPT
MNKPLSHYKRSHCGPYFGGAHRFMLLSCIFFHVSPSAFAKWSSTSSPESGLFCCCVVRNGAGEDANEDDGDEDDRDIEVVSEAGEMAGGGCWCRCFGDVSAMATLAADDGAPGEGGRTVAGTSGTGGCCSFFAANDCGEDREYTA